MRFIHRMLVLDVRFEHSYPQVYPQINLTDIFMIFPMWREVEDSGG